MIGAAAGRLGIVHGNGGNQIGTLASPIDPLLGPLADHGDPSFTMPLLEGSPAIDAGDVLLTGTTDQRDVVRPQGEGVDIGAFEVESSIPQVDPARLVGECITLADAPRAMMEADSFQSIGATIITEF